MVSLINITNGIKETTHGYQIRNTSQISGYVKVRESLYTQILVWVNTILKHIDTRANLPRYESCCLVYRPGWYRKRNTIKYPYSTGMREL